MKYDVAVHLVCVEYVTYIFLEREGRKYEIKMEERAGEKGSGTEGGRDGDK